MFISIESTSNYGGVQYHRKMILFTPEKEKKVISLQMIKYSIIESGDGGLHVTTILNSNQSLWTYVEL